MNITFVKKILKDGQPCQKCQDVEKRLIDSGQMDRIDTVLVADERDPDSPGNLLANEVGAARAPFFVVEDGGEKKVYTVYFKFAKEVLGNKQTKAAENQEILNDNPDLDFI
ncbi:MAG: hypothetical protein ACE37D_03995 [Pseudomonadales bacterium]|jgi:hypothetical protein